MGEILWVLWEGWRLWCAVKVDDRRRAKGENGPGGVSDDGSNCRDSNDLDRLSSVVSSSSSGRGGGGQRQGQEGKEGLDKCPVRILIQIFLDRESNFGLGILCNFARTGYF